MPRVVIRGRNIEVAYDDFEDILEDFEVGEKLQGFHVGGGVELGLEGPGYLRVDYTFTNYGDFEDEDEDVAVGAGLTRHQVMFGLGFRF